MTEVSFVVNVEGAAQPIKHFGAYVDAVSYAQRLVDDAEADFVKVYAVPFRETKDAVSAYQAGSHKLLRAFEPPLSERDVQIAKDRAWEEAEKLGPEAMLDFLMKNFDLGKST